MSKRPSFRGPSCLMATIGLVILGSCAVPTQAGYDAYERGEYNRAMRLWMPLAEKGDASAQYLIGLLHDEGRGMDVDYATAAVWYQRAAEQGHPAAQNNLGALFLLGRGVESDLDRAQYWLTRSADQDFEQARKNLAIASAMTGLVQEQVATGPVTAEVVAEGQMSPQALRAWGESLDLPEDRDYRLIDWIRQCANDGDPKAQFTLGRLYLSGSNGLVADPTLAAAWFRKAAEAGQPEAQTAYGLMVLRGQGVGRNESEAAQWLERSAGQGDSIAQYNLGLMLLRGRGVAADETRAVALIESAANQGLPSACTRAGMLLESGVGGTKDPIAATAWYLHASDLGDPTARTQVARMEQNLGADQFGQAQVLARAMQEVPSALPGRPAAPSGGR